MNELQNKRLVILAAAGALFAATTYGWVQQVSHGNAATKQKQPVVAKVEPAPVTTVQTIASVEPVTRISDVVPLAKASAGRPDPMAPVGLARPRTFSNAPVRTAAPSRLYDGVVLPPPPDPVASEPMQSSPWRAQQPHVVANVQAQPIAVKDAVRLVGLMDGKAIFTVPYEVANQHHIMSTFTLGQGQQYAGFKVESIDSAAVTIGDGRSVCTKTLSAIR